MRESCKEAYERFLDSVESNMKELLCDGQKELAHADRRGLVLLNRRCIKVRDAQRHRGSAVLHDILPQCGVKRESPPAPTFDRAFGRRVDGVCPLVR